MAALEEWAKGKTTLRYEIKGAPNIYGIAHGRLELNGEFLDVSFLLVESYEKGIQLLHILWQFKDVPGLIFPFAVVVVRGEGDQFFLMVEKITMTSAEFTMENPPRYPQAKWLSREYQILIRDILDAVIKLFEKSFFLVYGFNKRQILVVDRGAKLVHISSFSYADSVGGRPFRCELTDFLISFLGNADMELRHLYQTIISNGFIEKLRYHPSLMTPTERVMLPIMTDCKRRYQTNRLFNKHVYFFDKSTNAMTRLHWIHRVPTAEVYTILLLSHPRNSSQLSLLDWLVEFRNYVTNPDPTKIQNFTNYINTLFSLFKFSRNVGVHVNDDDVLRKYSSIGGSTLTLSKTMPTVAEDLDQFLPVYTHKEAWSRQLFTSVNILWIEFMRNLEDRDDQYKTGN